MSGSPPCAAWKNTVPWLRSKYSISTAAVRLGTANRMRIWLMKVVMANMGICIQVMPGVRSLSMVTSRFTAPASDAAPSTTSEMVQNVTPLLALYAFSVSGA